jgi:hypothetical protein
MVLVVRRRGHPAATREAAGGFPVTRGRRGVFAVVGVKRASVLIEGGSIFGIGLLQRADGARSCSEQMSEKEKERKRKMYA